MIVIGRFASGLNDMVQVWVDGRGCSAVNGRLPVVVAKSCHGLECSFGLNWITEALIQLGTGNLSCLKLADSD